MGICMSSRARCCTFLISLVLIAGTAKLATAADKAPKNKFEGSGTIEAMQGSVWIVNISDTKWKVAFNADSKLTVTGIAAPEALPRMVGALVRFNAEPDAKGKVSGEINDLELFTMVWEGRGKDKKQVAPSSNYNQMGAIKVAKGNKLTVSGKSGEMHIELAEGAPIKINGAFPAVVAVGDLVKLKGDSTVPGQLNASEATVTLSKTVGEKKKPKVPEKTPKPEPAVETK